MWKCLEWFIAVWFRWRVRFNGELSEGERRRLFEQHLASLTFGSRMQGVTWCAPWHLIWLFHTARTHQEWLNVAMLHQRLGGPVFDYYEIAENFIYSADTTVECLTCYEWLRGLYVGMQASGNLPLENLAIMRALDLRFNAADIRRLEIFVQRHPQFENHFPEFRHWQVPAAS